MSFKIILTTSVTRPCFTTQHLQDQDQDQNQDRFLVADRSCPGLLQGGGILKLRHWRCLCALVDECRRNGSCGRPVRYNWVSSASRYEAAFDIEHVGMVWSLSRGTARIVYTDYRSALVYQCLQVLADGACLPGQVSVELWNRRPTMPETRYDVHSDLSR